MLLCLAPLMLLILLCGLVAACLLIGGFLFARENEEAVRQMPAWKRIASSIMLVLIAWLWLFIINIAQSAEPNITRTDNLENFMVLGITLSFIGELFLARLISLSRNVPVGMIFLGFGSVAYSISFLLAGELRYIARTPPQPVIVIIWLIITTILWYIVVFRRSEKTSVHYAALAYLLLIATTAGLATLRAFQSPDFSLVAIGATLFLFSNVILAARVSRHEVLSWMDDVVWLTRGVGQMLIVSGRIWYPFLLLLMNRR